MELDEFHVFDFTACGVRQCQSIADGGVGVGGPFVDGGGASRREEHVVSCIDFFPVLVKIPYAYAITPLLVRE